MNAPKRIRIMREIAALVPKHGLTFSKMSGKELRMALRAARELARKTAMTALVMSAALFSACGGIDNPVKPSPSVSTADVNPPRCDREYRLEPDVNIRFVNCKE